MNWIEQTVREFGQTLGFERLSLDGGNRVSLDFDALGRLSIERSDRGVLVYLVRELPHASEHALIESLNLSHFRQRNRYQLHAGLCGGDELLFLAVVPESEFIPSTLQYVFDCLCDCHDRAANSSTTPIAPSGTFAGRLP